MQILYGPNFKLDKPTVVTIGKFDGLHKGHLKVISKLKELSEERSLSSVIYTFNKNPRNVLEKMQILPLMSNEEKSLGLSLMNIDYLIYENFDLNFANMLPEEFVKKVLVEKLKARVVIMGENSTFGRNRLGNVELMKDLGDKYDFSVEVIELLKENGEVISSSRLRECAKNY